MMNSTLGDPNLQCGETINFRSSEEHRDRGWFVIRSFMGVVRKNCRVGQDKGSMSLCVVVGPKFESLLRWCSSV